jgi:uncharacterized membrane protein YhhN
MKMQYLWLLGLLIPADLSVHAVKTGKYRFKMAVTPSCMGLMAAALIAQNRTVPGFALLIGAFGFSIVGDSFLSFREGRKNFYLYGIACFFCAHVLYLCYALAKSGSALSASVLTCILAVLATIYYVQRLYRHAGSPVMKAALYVYLFISCVTFSFTVFARTGLVEHILLTIGIGLILFSDLCIGETDFAGNPRLKEWILPTYYLAHVLITASVLAAI